MTKCQAGTILKSKIMNCQVHAIGNALRPLFADPVTFLEFPFSLDFQRNGKPKFQLYMPSTVEVTALQSGNNRTETRDNTEYKLQVLN